MNRSKIFCRVTMPDGSLGSFYTGIKIDKKYFQNGAIISALPEHQPMIDILVETYYEVMGQEPYPNETGQMFVDRLKGRKDTAINMVPKTILEAMRYTIDRKNTVTKSRMSAYSNAFKYLYEFLNESMGYGDMKLRQLNPGVFDEWTDWLRTEKNLSLKTSQIYMSTVHGSIEYVAKRFIMYDEVPGYNPIQGAGALNSKQKRKLQKKTLRNHLTAEDIDKLEKYTVSQVRDTTHSDDLHLMYVLWQINTGAAFSDTFYGEYDIITNHQDEKFLHYHRIKTEEECFIPMTDKIQSIINFFINKGEWIGSMGFLVRNHQGKEMAEFQAYRRFLSRVVEPLLNKKVTSHTLRHTFGMMMINTNGYSADQVQRMMGHTDISTTMNNYARLNLQGMAKKS